MIKKNSFTVFAALLIFTLAFQGKSESLTGTTEIVSVSSSGEIGDSVSFYPSISADGQIVAFLSRSNNLVLGDLDDTFDLQVFIHDRLSRETEVVSVSPDGGIGNGDSTWVSISASGYLVAFASESSNLVSDDTNDRDDIFVHNRLTRETEIVSVSSSGVIGNGSSANPSISADGQFVAFTSSSSNLVSGDTNKKNDIFVHNRLTGETEIVSISPEGEIGNQHSSVASISADGQFVAFQSASTNLDSNYANNTTGVFVHDRSTGMTEMVSIASSGENGNGVSHFPSISADGQFVTFTSSSSNLVSDDTNDQDDIFIHNRLTGETEIVSVSSSGEAGTDDSFWSSISADGQLIAFQSRSYNLDFLDTNSLDDIFVHNRLTGETKIVSVSSSGEVGNDISSWSSISANGQVVAFQSKAINFSLGVPPTLDQIYVHQTNILNPSEPTPTPTLIPVKDKAIVFVHGWRGLGSKDDCVNSGPLNNIVDDYFADLDDYYKNSSYHVEYAYIRTTPCETPHIIHNVRHLETAINAAKRKSNADKVIIIAHSMGGLVSRAYLESNLYRGDVSHLITLGTPHLGANAAAINLMTSFKCGNGFIGNVWVSSQDGLCDFTAGIDEFNKLFSTRRVGVKYILIGGDLIDSNATSKGRGAIRLIQGPDDGIVSLRSAIGLPGSHYIVGSNFDGHSPLLAHKTFMNAAGLTYGCIPLILEFGDDGCLLPVTQRIATDSTVNESEVDSKIIQGEISAKEILTQTIGIDGDNPNFIFLSSDEQLSFKLIAPSGEFYEEDGASLNAAPYTYFKEDNSTYFDIETDEHGNWKVVLQFPESYEPEGDVFFQLGVLYETDLTLNFERERLNYFPNELIEIDANLVGDYKNVDAWAEILFTDQTTTTINLTESDSGKFQGELTAPNKSGLADIDVYASGQHLDGTEFKRVQSDVIQISDQNIVLTDEYHELTDQAQNSDLIIDVGLMSGIDANVILSADLVTQSGEFIVSGVSSHFILTGKSSQTLSFDRETILESGYTGQYILTNLRVTNADELLMLTDFDTDVFTTQEYINSDQGPEIYLPLILNRP